MCCIPKNLVKNSTRLPPSKENIAYLHVWIYCGFYRGRISFSRCGDLGTWHALFIWLLRWTQTKVSENMKGRIVWTKPWKISISVCLNFSIDVLHVNYNHWNTFPSCVIHYTRKSKFWFRNITKPKLLHFICTHLSLKPVQTNMFAEIITELNSSTNDYCFDSSHFHLPHKIRQNSVQRLININKIMLTTHNTKFNYNKF